MVIDVHVHPNGYPQVAQDPASRAFRDRVFQRRPQDALSAPIAMTGKPSGGNGGGKPDFAMAGARDLTKIDEALASVEGLVAEMLQK